MKKRKVKKGFFCGLARGKQLKYSVKKIRGIFRCDKNRWACEGCPAHYNPKA